MCGDLAWEVSRSSKGTVKPGADENLGTMLVPPEASTENEISQTHARVQGNLLREYEQRFADLIEHANLSKLCSNSGFSKKIVKGQIFITLDDDILDSLKGSCRSCT